MTREDIVAMVQAQRTREIRKKHDNWYTRYKAMRAEISAYGIEASFMPLPGNRKVKSKLFTQLQGRLYFRAGAELAKWLARSK